MIFALLTMLNFFPGLACCDSAVDPSSCEPFHSIADVGGCEPELDVELAWCLGLEVLGAAPYCAALVPHVGDYRCCPISKPFSVDASSCAWPLGEAMIWGETYYGCDGYSEAVYCDAWAVDGDTYTCAN